MKNYKKCKFILSIMFILCAALNFVGCSKSGPIPDGYYVPTRTEESFAYKLCEYSLNGYDGPLLRIKGNISEHSTSGFVDYKGKIVEENNKIYIYGFKWKDIFSSTEMGSTTNYEAIYDEELKTITMIILM